VERAGIAQAMFDYFAKDKLVRPTVASVTVSTALPAFPAKTRFCYRTFAAVTLVDRRAGPAVVLVGYYVAPLSGWRLPSGPGTASVGCDV
jgi:hypothetical protein